MKINVTVPHKWNYSSHISNSHNCLPFQFSRTSLTHIFIKTRKFNCVKNQNNFISNQNPKAKSPKLSKQLNYRERKRELPICGEKIRNVSRSSDARAKRDAHRFFAIERLGEKRDGLRRWQRGTKRHRIHLNSLSEMLRWVMRMMNGIWGWRSFLMWIVGWSQKGIQRWKGREQTYTSETGEPGQCTGECRDTRL